MINNHETWVRVLKRVCKEHALLLASYPLHEMTVRDLQKISLSPDLFQSRLAKTSPCELERLSEISLSSETREISNSKAVEVCTIPWSFHCDTFLIPGGRYLLSHFFNSIMLYDLGVPYIHPTAPLSLVCQEDIALERHFFVESTIHTVQLDAALVRTAISYDPGSIQGSCHVNTGFVLLPLNDSLHGAC